MLFNPSGVGDADNGYWWRVLPVREAIRYFRNWSRSLQLYNERVNRRGVVVLSVFAAIVVGVWFGLHVWSTSWEYWEWDGSSRTYLRVNRITGQVQLRHGSSDPWKDFESNT